MSQSNEANDVEENTEENNEAPVDFDNLSETQKQRIMSNPEVRKMIEYSESNLPQIVGMLDSFIPDEDEDETDETYELFITEVADGAGRVQPDTIDKILREVVKEGKAGTN